VGIRRVLKSILIRLANMIGIARKMALRSEGAPDCNQETSRYRGIMPHLVSIYKNDFVKDIFRKSCLSPSLWLSARPRSSQQSIAFTDSRQAKRCAGVAKPAWLKAKTDS
jgi:hypothetical protein